VIWNSLLAPIIIIVGYAVSVFPEPDPTIITYITSSLTTVRSWLTALNFVIDIPTLGIILGFAILIEFTILGFHALQWILQNLTVGLFHPTK
jgi:hypothetical protein